MTGIEELVADVNKAYSDGVASPISGCWLTVKDDGKACCCAVGAAYLQCNPDMINDDGITRALGVPVWITNKYNLEPKLMWSFIRGFDGNEYDAGLDKLDAWSAGNALNVKWKPIKLQCIGD